MPEPGVDGAFWYTVILTVRRGEMPQTMDDEAAVLAADGDVQLLGERLRLHEQVAVIDRVIAVGILRTGRRAKHERLSPRMLKRIEEVWPQPAMDRDL